MPWRIAQILSPKRDATYEVAMSFSYLMNCVATLAIAGVANIPDELIPATTILDESELVPGEIRAIYEKEVKFGDKPFLQVKRVRDLRTSSSRASRCMSSRWRSKSKLNLFQRRTFKRSPPITRRSARRSWFIDAIADPEVPALCPNLVRPLISSIRAFIRRDDSYHQRGRERRRAWTAGTAGCNSLFSG